MTTALETVFPKVHKDYTTYNLPEGLTRMSGAFMGCVVNVGKDGTPVQTKPHCDVKESIFGVSCLCPFGHYSGGALILWELQIIIKLGPGDLLSGLEIVVSILRYGFGLARIDKIRDCSSCHVVTCPPQHSSLRPSSPLPNSNNNSPSPKQQH
jgi:hypothetical protein